MALQLQFLVVAGDEASGFSGFLGHSAISSKPFKLLIGRFTFYSSSPFTVVQVRLFPKFCLVTRYKSGGYFCLCRVCRYGYENNVESLYLLARLVYFRKLGA